MGLGHSPRIITDGMVLYLDAANPKNYNLTAVEVLVVAGGGAGGQDFAGGGGGGGVIYNSNFAVTPGSAITVTVGGGGVRPVGAVGQGSGTTAQGGNSIFGSLTAIGGGGGAGSASSNNAGNGGSGGGAGSGRTAGTGTSGQGFAGASTASGVGGGGGGAGGVGFSNGEGGPGLGFNISGTFRYHGGGGGGADNNNAAISGGIGGGGTNGGFQAASNNGIVNTGGGGSAYYGSWGGAGNGGSGIVIVRYSGPQKAIGGTVTSINGDTIHTFTTVGSTTFTPLVATNNSAILGLSDLSGRGNFGTTVNSPTYSSSGGGSIVFDGTNDYVTSSFATTSGQAVTYTGWLYSTETTATYRNFIDSVTARPMIWWNTSGQIEFDAAYYTTTTVYRNQWVYVALSKPSGSSSASYYVNGVLVGSGTAYTTPAVTPTWFNRAAAQTWIGNCANAQVYNRALTAAEIQQNYNALKGRYTLDGSTSDRAAPSASYLVSLGITADGIYWINLPTAGPTQIYCILNPAYDGGGWMMAMKATRGTTFNYSANYWTTANTLNPTQTNRNDGDAKFNSMNYFQAKDMMAVWPDISNGGSIPGSTLGWTWLENNFNDGTRITPISFFGITYPTMNTGGSGKFIKDAKTFSGWTSGVFSSQADVRFYGFNYTNNPSYGVSAKCRWGFGWNENGEGLYPSSGGGAPGSNDVSGGIGMDTSFGSYSAGDVIVCCQDTIGINRSARVEVYVR